MARSCGISTKTKVTQDKLAGKAIQASKKCTTIMFIEDNKLLSGARRKSILGKNHYHLQEHRISQEVGQGHDKEINDHLAPGQSN